MPFQCFYRTNEHIFASHGLKRTLQRPLIAALEQKLLLERVSCFFQRASVVL